MSNHATLQLDAVCLRFPLLHGGARSLKKTVLGALGGQLGGQLTRTQQGRVEVDALHDISLRMASGARIGLVGGNGAGKTSLLRVLAGIYPPTRGTIHTQGRIHALLHPGQGMQPDLTGRENIRLGGLYHGLSGPALRRLEDDVAGFVEKARTRLEDIVRGAEILVLATHHTDVLRNWCDRVIWLEQGRIRGDGAAADILDAYQSAAITMG